MVEPRWNFEGEPPFEARTEAGINLCAYFDAMPDAKLKTWNPGFTDEQLMAWDGNFKSDGDLLLPCCESRRWMRRCTGVTSPNASAIATVCAPD